MNGLRLAAVRVSAELMHEFFSPHAPGQWVRCDSGIPRDAEYVRSYYDNYGNCFVFVYTHPSFPLVPPDGPVGLALTPMFSAIHLNTPVTTDQTAMLNRAIAEQKQRLPVEKDLAPGTDFVTLEMYRVPKGAAGFTSQTSYPQDPDAPTIVGG